MYTHTNIHIRILYIYMYIYGHVPFKTGQAVPRVQHRIECASRYVAASGYVASSGYVAANGYIAYKPTDLKAYKPISIPLVSIF